MQISPRAARAPFAVGIVVAGAGTSLNGLMSAGADRLVLDRGIDLFEKRQRDVTRQVDRSPAPGRAESAPARHTWSAFRPWCPRGCCRRPRDGRLGVAGIQREKFLLGRDGCCAHSSKRDQLRGFAVGASASMIAECDGARFELRHGRACAPRERPRCGNPARCATASSRAGRQQRSACLHPHSQFFRRRKRSVEAPVCPRYSDCWRTDCADRRTRAWQTARAEICRVKDDGCCGVQAAADCQPCVG